MQNPEKRQAWGLQVSLKVGELEAESGELLHTSAQSYWSPLPKFYIKTISFLSKNTRGEPAPERVVLKTNEPSPPDPLEYLL